MGQLLSEGSSFSQRVFEEMARARRSNTRFSIVIFTSRPAAGEFPELACKRALPPLLANVRDTDSVARISDDSIAVLLIDADAAGTRSAADRLLARLAEHAGDWDVSVVDQPSRETLLADLGLVA